MNYKIVRISALCALMTTCAFAQKKDTLSSIMQLKEVVVSDSKFAMSKEKSGKVIVKITADDLAKRAGQSLATVLSSVAGLEMNGNQSAAGKNISYYVRGARNRQTLILVDGMPVTDASGINLDYDLRLIPVEQVESIEILKGAASTLYGSGAAAGVINITLKKAGKQAIAGNAYMSLGTQTTADKVKYNPQDFNQGFNVNGSLKRFNYYASLNSTETKGISEAQGANFEEDRFSRVNTLVKLGFKPTKKMTFDAFVGYDRMKNNFDGTFDNFNNPDTPLNVSLTEQFRFGFSPKFQYNKGEFVLNSNVNNVERYSDIFSTWTNSVEVSDYKSKNVNVDAFNKYVFSSRLFVVLGGQFQFYEMNSVYESIDKKQSKFYTVDPYLNAVFSTEFGLNLNAGVRMNNHSVYGNKWVYNINPSYTFTKWPLKVLASYSTAFITPSLYQLYSPYGNLELTPEENSTVEVGFETSLMDKKLTFNAVTFYREEENGIGFYTNPTTYKSNYINVAGNSNAKGLESMISYAFSQDLKANANYTFTQMETKLNRLIPKHKANVAIDYQFLKGTFVTLNYQWIDQRSDIFYDGGTNGNTAVVLPSYQLFNAIVKKEVIKNRMIVFGSVSNIFNESFVETVGYNTRGRNFKIGLNILF
jgi:vitamin B12 transporter